MSTQENRTNTLKEAKKAIRRAMLRKRPVFLWGPPGVGKSDLVNQLAGEVNGYMIDLRLALMEPTDLRGIPYYNQAENNMSWAPPVDLPSQELAKEFETIILFLDEMNSAPMATQAAAYQLVLNRRIGTYELPNNVVIVAAGNRETDRGVTYRMPAPLANRFVHIEVTADFDTWQEWAVERQIHPDVLGYLTFAKNDLYSFDSCYSALVDVCERVTQRSRR
jgi:MoxR-like ATPase